MPDYDPLTISDEELKKLPPAERGAVYKARAAARAAGGTAPAAAAAAPPPAAPAPQAAATPAPPAAATPAPPPAAAPTPVATGTPATPPAAASTPAATGTPATPPSAAPTPVATGTPAAASTPAATPATPPAGSPAPAATATPATPPPPAPRPAPAPTASGAPAGPSVGSPPAAATAAPTPAAAPATAAPKPAPPPEPEKPKEPDFVQKVLSSVEGSAFQWRHGYAEMKVPRERLLDAARALHQQGFDYLSFITEVDWQDHLELIYHLFSYDYRAQPIGAILRCELPRDGMPEVASLTPVWPGAEFMEREAFEMMGISFLGHPDLRRILLPDDFVGFPMRRDYENDWDYITVKQLAHPQETP